MRKVYILKDNEEDGAVLDVLTARGCPADETQLENPKCPVCGADLLLAYCEGDGELEVLTWFSLCDEREIADAETWYLVCCDFTCDYEEQVERVAHPADAELFDLQISHESLDEYCGLISRRPSEQKELIQYLNEVLKARPNRKLRCYLDEAEWRYEDGMKRVQKWLRRIPDGAHIQFDMDGQKIKAVFLAATDEAILVQTRPEGEMLAIRAEAIAYWSPKRFDQQPPEERSEPDKPLDASKLIAIEGRPEMVVVRGHHLGLEHIDRFGQYHVWCCEESTARELGLHLCKVNYWRGCFRRSEIEMRYDVRRYVKARGYWVEVWGHCNDTGQPAVQTEDPAAAEVLELERFPYWWEEMELPETPLWSGVVPPELVEEEKEVKVYHWPIPEVKGSDSVGDKG